MAAATDAYPRNRYKWPPGYPSTTDAPHAEHKPAKPGDETSIAHARKWQRSKGQVIPNSGVREKRCLLTFAFLESSTLGPSSMSKKPLVTQAWSSTTA